MNHSNNSRVFGSAKTLDPPGNMQLILDIHLIISDHFRAGWKNDNSSERILKPVALEKEKLAQSPGI